MRWILLPILLMFTHVALAQRTPQERYPKGYFRNPLGIPISLSGNFGELRPNHWHMGLDFRTNKKENYPVYAAAEGYIAKIGISSGGYGRVIYINHPNGLTTLYAHLNEFYPELENFVREQQYKQESWRINLDLQPGQFPVTRGQYIALSGNTGGSQAPHLHFEIRDTKSDKVLNPMLFGFNIADRVKPSILRLALYDRCKSTYEQSPRLLALKKIKDTFVTNPATITCFTERVSFAITAYDKQSGSDNLNGIYEAQLFHNGAPVVGFELDSISYNETRYMNAQIDYKTRYNGGSYLQHLSQLEGNNSPVYKQYGGDGVIYIDDRQVHNIIIHVSDAHGNVSVVKLAVQMDSLAAATPRKDSLPVLQERRFLPGNVNVFETDDLNMYLGEHCLYDSVTFGYVVYAASRFTLSRIHVLHTPSVPLHQYFPLRIKPTAPFDSLLRNRVVMIRRWGGDVDVSAVEWQHNYAMARWRELGQFELALDTLPPTLNVLNMKDSANFTRATKIVVTAGDNLRQVKNFRAELDGQWLMFVQRGNTFTYKMDERCSPGWRRLKVKIEDEAGNSTEKEFVFLK
jgi:Peptidase family M23